MFSRVLVANHREIAVRWSAPSTKSSASGRRRLLDRRPGSLYVRLADRAVCIGPPSAGDSYSASRTIAAAETTGCEAVHPGTTSSPRTRPRAGVRGDGAVFVGPGADVMERMGDKARAKEEMRAANVPLVPGTRAPPRSTRCGRPRPKLGFPVLLKAVAAVAAGDAPRPLGRRARGCLSTARVEAEVRSPTAALPGEGARSPRHVEFQVMCDRDGGVLTLGERGARSSAATRSSSRSPPRPRSTRRCATRWRRRPSGPAARSARERGHLRVPARRRRHLPLHGAECAPPGRAPGQRAGDRDRPRPGAAARRRRRAALRDGSRRAAGTRSRSGSTPRIPPAGSRPRPDGRAFPAPARARRPRRHPPRGGLGDLTVLRLADREARRLGGGSAGGDCARCARAGGDGAGRDPDHARARPRHPPLARVRGGRLLDELPRGDAGRLPALAAG